MHEFFDQVVSVFLSKISDAHPAGSLFSTEDMSFEFKKAFAKATELRSLTFSQQWTMTDDSIFTTETPVSMALFNVPPGKEMGPRSLLSSAYIDELLSKLSPQ